ncbi:MAG: hypothetical protein GWN58_47595, partial [Anaerolineae bacterium]|nr:hypothetical protein [Anaerolineae bacterium]
EALGALTEAQVLALRQDLADDVGAVQLLGDILAHARQARATGAGA